MAALAQERARLDRQQRNSELDSMRSQLGSLLRRAEDSVTGVELPSDCLRDGPDGDEKGARPLQLRLAEAQDALKALRHLRRRLDVLITEEEGLEPAKHHHSGQGEARRLQATLDSAYSRLHSQLHDAQFQHTGSNRHSSGRQQLLSQRQQLLGNPGEGGAQFLRRRQLRTEADRAAASADVTQSLRRTQQVMAQEVQRGLGTLEVLDDSTSTLARSNLVFRQQKGKLGTAQSHLTALQRMNRMDRLILVLGCLFFFAVCAYIVHARVPLLQRLVSFCLSPFTAFLPWRAKGVPQPGDYRMETLGGETIVHSATKKTCIAGQCF